MTLRRVDEIAEALAGIARSGGGSVLMTRSRRTGASGLALLRARLGGFSTAIWDGSGENPCFAYLALADAVLVTGDSVSMISEAAAIGKPAGITRSFCGRIESWSYSVPDDTARAGAALRAVVLGRRKRA